MPEISSQARIALEWLDQNMHTSYPFAFSGGTPVTSVSGIVLPPSFIVDLQLAVDAGIVGEVADNADEACSGFYVSAIEATAYGETGEQGYVLEVSYGTYGAVAKSQLVPAVPFADNTLSGRTFPLYAVGATGYASLDSVQGSVIIGTCSDMAGHGTLTFTADGAPLLPTKIMLVARGLRSVTVIDNDGDGLTVSDDLVLQAGSGIALDVDTDTNTITISDTTVYDQSADDMVDSLVEEVYNRLGAPIRSINGIGPDATGDFTLAGGDCTEVAPNGTTGVRVNNPCSRPCCGDVNREQLETALASLETAQARLLAYYQALSNNVNNIQARLSSLLAMK